MIDQQILGLCSQPTVEILELLDKQYPLNIVLVPQEKLMKYGDGNGIIRGIHYYLDAVGAHMVEIAYVDADVEDNEPTEAVVLHELVHAFQTIVMHDYLKIEDSIKEVFFYTNKGWSPNLIAQMKEMQIDTQSLEAGKATAESYPQYKQKGTLSLEIPAFGLMCYPELVLALYKKYIAHLW